MQRMMAHILVVLAVTMGVAKAQGAGEAPRPSVAAVETLQRVAERGRITLGYREDALPFSHRGLQRPAGFSIDLCLAVVESLRRELRREVAVEWWTVTTETRIADLLAGRIDLECGSTTINAERERRAAFSPVIFFAATRLLVRRDSAIQGIADLAGRTVVATAGTTNAEVVQALLARRTVQLTLVTEPDHAQSFARLVGGQAEALAGDDVLLHGLLASAPGGDAFRVAGPPLSHEPYGLMFRRDDPAFAALIRHTFERLARAGALRDLHARWFTWHLPGGGALALPMDAQLAAQHRALGASE